MWFMSRRWGTLSARTPNAGFFALPTEARLGRRFYIKTKTRAESTLRSILTTRIFFLPPCGNRGGRRGGFRAAAPVADSIARTTAGAHGNDLKNTAFPKGLTGASALQWQLTRIVYTR